MRQRRSSGLHDFVVDGNHNEDPDRSKVVAHVTRERAWGTFSNVGGELSNPINKPRRIDRSPTSSCDALIHEVLFTRIFFHLRVAVITP